ncbi:MAG: substrate-binding domain-containing protein [Solirubrobacterales bacterium]
MSLASLVVAVGVLLAACGGGDSTSAVETEATSGADTSGETETASAGWLEEANEIAAETIQVPTEIEANQFGPVTPAKGELLYFIACDQSIPGCVAQVKGFEGGAEAAGYETKVCDAKFEVAAFQNCMNQAVQAGPAAIVNNARPQSDAPEAYKKAHSAEIPVIGQFTSEEPEPETGNAGEVGLVCEHEAEILASQIIAATEGEANVAIFADTVYRCNQQRADGLQNVFDNCDTCEVTVKQYSAATAQTDLPPQYQAEIQSNPDLNWIVAAPGFSGTMAADAIRQAGKSDSIAVGTFDGEDPELALLRKEDIVQVDVLSGIYENGWCVVDLISRLLADEPVPGNIENPTQMALTPENVPAEGSFEGAEGFEEQFKKLWGVS